MKSTTTANRDKLIKLLYIVLLGMLSLSVSREVLKGFGHVNQSITGINQVLELDNTRAYSAMETPKLFAHIKEASDSMHLHLEQIKTDLITLSGNPDDYQKMDSSEAGDRYFLNAGIPTVEAKAFLSHLKSYQQFMGELFAPLSKEATTQIAKRFFTEERYLENQIEGYPLITTLTKLSLFQALVRLSEKELLWELSKDALEQNVITKTKEVDHQILLAKKVPPSVVATKMNVLYRGIENPVQISIPGVSPDKVQVTAPGLKRRSGSDYLITPRKGKTLEVAIRGVLADGSATSTVKTFRIKELPTPLVSLRGKTGVVSLPLTSFSKGLLKVSFPGFDFPLSARVVSFRLLVPGVPSTVVKGDRFNEKAISNLKRMRKGQRAIISDMEIESDIEYHFSAPPILSLELI